jgi:hypothetical protein
VSASDLAIVAALVFAWALSARLERFEVAAPITFVLAGVLPGVPHLPERRLIRRASWPAMLA